jgi:hypothetical protein
MAMGLIPCTAKERREWEGGGEVKTGRGRDREREKVGGESSI